MFDRQIRVRNMHKRFEKIAIFFRMQLWFSQTWPTLRNQNMPFVDLRGEIGEWLAFYCVLWPVWSYMKIVNIFIFIFVGSSRTDKQFWTYFWHHKCVGLIARDILSGLTAFADADRYWNRSVHRDAANKHIEKWQRTWVLKFLTFVSILPHNATDWDLITSPDWPINIYSNVF